MPNENSEDVFPDGNLLFQVERESVLSAEKLFHHNLIEKHIKEGFLSLSSIEYDLSVVTVPNLKGILSSHNLKVTGKKADLISRIIDNVSENDIRALVPDSYYLLTLKGKAAKEEWLEADRLAVQKERVEGQQKRIAEMESYAPLIASKNFGVNVISSSTDVHPEAIYRCLRDLDLLEYEYILAAVDYAILGSDLRTVINDMACLGFTMDEKTVWQVIAGTRSYVAILNMQCWAAKYQVHSRDNKLHCNCCQSFDGKIFLIDEAKVGSTLPPFCGSCVCYVTGISDE